MANNSSVWLKLYFGFAWLQFAVLISIATYLLLIPDPGDSFESYWDKFLHVLCWFVLFGSLKLPCILRENIWRIALMLFAYSCLLEFAQYFLPPRTFSLWDAFSNALGIVLAYLLSLLLEPLVKRYIAPYLK